MIEYKTVIGLYFMTTRGQAELEGKEGFFGESMQWFADMHAFEELLKTNPDPNTAKQAFDKIKTWWDFFVRHPEKGNIIAQNKDLQSNAEMYKRLRKEYQNKYEQKEKEQQLSELEKVIVALGISLESRTAEKINSLDLKVQLLYEVVKAIGTSLTDPQNVVLTQKIVDTLSDGKITGTKVNLLAIAQVVQSETIQIKGYLKPNTDDPQGFAEAMEMFDFALVDTTAAMVFHLQEILDKKLASQESARMQKKEEKSTDSEQIEVAKLLNLTAHQQINAIRSEFGLKAMYFGENDDKKTRSQRALNIEEQELISSGKSEILKIISSIEKTIAPIKEDLNKDIEERDQIFTVIKRKLVAKGELASIEESQGFSDENIIILRTLFKNNNDVLSSIQRAQELSLLISKRTILIDSLDLVLQWAIRLKGESKSEASENSEAIVEAIYNRLQNEAVPTNQEWRLPNFENLFNKKPAEALEFLAVAITQRIENYFVKALASGGTAFDFAGDSLDIFTNDKMFAVPLHGAEDLGTFQFFIENFPWERFLTEADQKDPENIVSFKKYMQELWTYRILAIQNSVNAASGVEKLWRGNEHTTYKDDIINHVAGKGGGGGNQGWDQGPYHHIRHSGKENKGEILFAKTFGEIEQSWQTPQYETFFIYHVEQHFNNFCYNNAGNQADLKKALLPDGSIHNKLVKEIKNKIDSKHPATPEGKKAAAAELQRTLRRDAPLIELARKKALWTIVHSLKLHEFDKGAIHVKLSRYYVKTYYRKVFATAESGVRWRPGLGTRIERATLDMETFTRLSVNLTAPNGEEIFDRVNLNYVNRDSVYSRWLLDLKMKAVDGFTAIFEEEDYDSSKSKDKDKVGLIQRRDQLNKYQLHPNQVIGYQREIADLMIKVVNWKNYENKPNGESLRHDDLDDLEKKQKLILKHERFVQLEEITNKIKTALDALGSGVTQDARNDVVMRTAADHAINLRYLVIKIKPKYTCTGSDTERLPIAIPHQRLIKVKEPDSMLEKTVALQISIQDLRNCQIDMSNDFVDWSSFPQNNNQQWVGYSGEAKRWYEMADLIKDDAVFAPIHSPDVQEKASTTLPSFDQEYDFAKTWIIKRKVQLINFKKGFKNDTRTRKSEQPRGILVRANESLSKFGRIFKSEKSDISDIRGATREVGVALDEHLRSRIEVSTIPEYELVSEAEEKGGKKPAGLGFPDVVQYASKYLIGKSPDLMILLEMFRDNVQNIEKIISQQARNPDSNAVESFGLEILTPVPDFLRRAVDEKLDGEAEKRRIKDEYKKKPEYKTANEEIEKINEEISLIYDQIESTQDDQERRKLEVQVKQLEGKIDVIKQRPILANYERDTKYASTKSKRAENEIKVGLFWTAVDAYLDQYAFDLDLSDRMQLETNHSRRALLMDKVDPISGGKAMNFTDRQILMQYVKAMLTYFESEKFAVGNERPTNIYPAGDVISMMTRKGIIGSSQQILVDLHYYEGDGYKALLKKSEAKKE